jgi:hypothetical protein
MFFVDLFRSFLPLRNPLGFGALDFIELAVAVVFLALLLFSRAWIEPYGRRLAQKTGWSMLILGLLPIGLRLALLWRYPIPEPNVSDDFSYVLLADTLRHLRLANPTHAHFQFFETYFALQQPTYSSIFPLAQGIVMAIGWTIFGHPWAGVALSVGAYCALCYWMLRAWISPGWAFMGGLFAMVQAGPLNQWMNSFWGGAVSAAAGCLVFGALPRVVDHGRRRDAVLLGVGLGVQMLSRPFESVFLTTSALIFFLPAARDWVRLRGLLKLAPAAILGMLPALLLILLQNHSVTGSWTTMPYISSRYQYGVPTTFTFQPLPVAHRALTPQQQLGFETQSKVHGPGTDTFASFWIRLGGRFRFYRFFLLAPLYLAIPFFLTRIRQDRFLWVLLTIAIFALGTNFYPYFYTHYIAAEACLFALISVVGLERLSQVTIGGIPTGQSASRLLLILCAAHFLFWYGLHALGTEDMLSAMRQFETWDAINHGDPDGRIAVNRKLGKIAGKLLIFVRYSPRHELVEWVHNGADVDAARVVWARDLGADEDQELMRYYPDRKAWLFEPDVRPPRLRPYSASIEP